MFPHRQPGPACPAEEEVVAGGRAVGTDGKKQTSSLQRNSDLGSFPTLTPTSQSQPQRGCNTKWEHNSTAFQLPVRLGSENWILI